MQRNMSVEGPDVTSHLERQKNKEKEAKHDESSRREQISNQEWGPYDLGR